MENDNVISKILNNIIIQNVVTAPLENIINKYTKRWFSADGTFAGFDAVAGDLDNMTDELTDSLQKAKASLDDKKKKMKSMEAEISSFDRDFKELTDADTESYLQHEKEINAICAQFDNRLKLFKDIRENPDVRNGIIKGTAQLY